MLCPLHAGYTAYTGTQGLGACCTAMEKCHGITLFDEVTAMVSPPTQAATALAPIAAGTDALSSLHLCRRAVATPYWSLIGTRSRLFLTPPRMVRATNRRNEFVCCSEFV